MSKKQFDQVGTYRTRDGSEARVCFVSGLYLIGWAEKGEEDHEECFWDWDGTRSLCGAPSNDDLIEFIGPATFPEMPKVIVDSRGLYEFENGERAPTNGRGSDGFWCFFRSVGGIAIRDKYGRPRSECITAPPGNITRKLIDFETMEVLIDTQAEDAE